MNVPNISKKVNISVLSIGNNSWRIGKAPDSGNLKDLLTDGTYDTGIGIAAGQGIEFTLDKPSVLWIKSSNNKDIEKGGYELTIADDSNTYHSSPRKSDIASSDWYDVFGGKILPANKTIKISSPKGIATEVEIREMLGEEEDSYAASQYEINENESIKWTDDLTYLTSENLNKFGTDIDNIKDVIYKLISKVKQLEDRITVLEGNA